MPLMISLHQVRLLSLLCSLLLVSYAVNAQTDSAQQWQLHFQQTVVTQHSPGFAAPYSGPNSLRTKEETQTSLTTTFYLGVKLYRGLKLYVNPEIAGGAGISRATGIAGFSNGETFRVGNPKPQVYIARLILEQYIPLSKERKAQEEDVNQLKGEIPTHYVKIVAGRFAVSDYFDNNSYSHDPRTRFLNWSLMGNGAYDYAANTRGYTWGTLLEYRTKSVALRGALAMVPTQANASIMDGDLKNALASQFETEITYAKTKKGIIRLLVFNNKARMGSYDEALKQTNTTPDIITTRKVGRDKYGIGVNVEQVIAPNVGGFFRASYNNGKTETWMFTEIDNSVSGGVVIDGKKWNRASDCLGMAIVSNGISSSHQNYLKAGGIGFMIGDGKLNYAREHIFEIFYQALVHDEHFFVSPDYQLIINPAYNRDRGVVHLFAIRVQTKF